MKSKIQYLSIVLLIMCTYIIQGDNFTITSSIDQILQKFYKNKPVLVTGGCGFIGSHLVEKLVEYGAQVTILDDLSSGNRENISSVIDKISLIIGNIIDKKTCDEATKDIEIIFHLAALTSVPESVENPSKYHLINGAGTENILESARINNVKRFVFSSSSAVYGNSKTVCDEAHQPNPESPYGFSKLVGEIYCHEYTHIYSMETVIMRYFNVYGKRQNPNGSYAGVVAKFIHNMEKNIPLTIFGDGLQTRDFIPVSDIVQANLVLGACPCYMIHENIFNIATGKSINLFELIEILKKQYPYYSHTINFQPERSGDVKNSRANCNKYFTLLNNFIEQNSSHKNYSLIR